MNVKVNIVLITADSLRADRLGCYGCARPTSPHLDRFAAESVRFSQAISNGPNTPHAFPAIMAGRSALLSPRLGLFDAPVTLAETLQQAGYQTIGFNAANPYVSRFFSYDRGFDEFYDYVDFEIPALEFSNSPDRNGGPASSVLAIPDLDVERYLVSEEGIKGKAYLESSINRDVCAAIARRSGGPLFLWVHYMDAHYPYVPQAQSQIELGLSPISREENLALNIRVRENTALSPDMLDKVEGLYDAAVHQLDCSVGALLQFLKRAGLYENSLIVFAADHGEEFLEHGDLQHKSKLYDELVRVPLLVKRPAMDRPEVRSGVVNLLQLAPTLLAEAGVPSPFPADSLFAVDSKQPVFSAAAYGVNGGTPVDADMFKTDRLAKRYALRNLQWKLIYDTGSGKFSLFNLLLDPAEQNDCFAAESEDHPDLRTRLLERISELEMARVRMQARRFRKSFDTLAATEASDLDASFVQGTN